MELHEFIQSQNFWARVDEWLPLPSEEIFKYSSNSIYLPVSEFFQVPKSKVLDNFILLSQRRCYNSIVIKSHICQYLNYFEKFYDKEHELLFYIYRIKQLMDTGYINENGDVIANYTLDNFKYDLKTYILSDSMYDKVWKMVEDNYYIDLNYKNKSNEGLQYSNTHGKYFMEISHFMNILIPLIMHFIYKNKIMVKEKIDELIYEIFNWLFEKYVDVDAMQKRGLKPVDMCAKLYETAITTMQSHCKSNKGIWTVCEIRGFSPTINANDAINTVIMQVMPKYTYSGNIISCNISSIRYNIKFNIDIQYEYDFSSLSSSKRDGEDNTSQFDKYEAHMIKTDESLIIHNKFISDKVMESIIARYGPFDDAEIDFYTKELINHGRPLINKFQQTLVNYMFLKYFENTIGIYSINTRQYVILMIAAKRIMLSSGMRLLPYIVAGNVIQISSRTTLSKKELVKVEQSEYYNSILIKYNGDEKKIRQLLSLIATILSSKFTIIDYYDSSINGMDIKVESDILIDEVLRFIIQI